MPFKPFPNTIDPARALAMYDDGASDERIAAALNVSQSGITRWRHRNGLVRRACNDNRLSDAQIRRAKNMLRSGATCVQIAAHLGVSAPTVQAIRRNTPTDSLKLGGGSRPVRAAVRADASLPGRIAKAIGLGVPSDIRMEAVNDMYLELLEGKLPISQIESAAPRFRSRAFSMAGYNYAARSIDEEDENGFTLADRLADPDGMRPFDEILERVFANDD